MVKPEFELESTRPQSPHSFCSSQSPVKDVIHKSNLNLSCYLSLWAKDGCPRPSQCSAPWVPTFSACLPGSGGGASCRLGIWDPGFGSDETPGSGAPVSGHGEPGVCLWGMGFGEGSTGWPLSYLSNPAGGAAIASQHPLPLPLLICPAAHERGGGLARGRSARGLYQGLP